MGRVERQAGTGARLGGVRSGGVSRPLGAAQSLSRVLQGNVAQGSISQRPPTGASRRTAFAAAISPGPVATTSATSTTTATSATTAETEGPTHASQRVGELSRDDPKLRAFALGKLRQHLEVLVGQQFRVGIALMDGVEDLQDSARIALRFQDRSLRLILELYLSVLSVFLLTQKST
jgi:hypothetical protein